MDSFDFMTAFTNGQHSAESIVKEIDALLSTDDLRVRVLPFGCEAKSIEWLAGKYFKNRAITLEWKANNLFLFRLTYRYKENGIPKENSGLFFILRDKEFEDVYVALTIESSKFYNRGLLPLFQGLYPFILTTFITHKKLQFLLEKFRYEGGYDQLTITRASQRLRFQEQHHGKRIMPMVSWPSMSLDEAFTWVQTHNGWFESISFDLGRQYGQVAHISFSRQGVLCTNSLLEKLFTSFIKPVCKNIHENIELFSHRARLERSDLKPRPIAIEFDADQFAEIAENQRFIQSMRRMKTASISVLHGNPYVHLSILDYLDGSAFDLWILDQRQLVIVPQLKGSVGSIKRLINHIFDEYAEGNLINYEEVG